MELLLVLWCLLIIRTSSYNNSHKAQVYPPPLTLGGVGMFLFLFYAIFFWFSPVNMTRVHNCRQKAWTNRREKCQWTFEQNVIKCSCAMAAERTCMNPTSTVNWCLVSWVIIKDIPIASVTESELVTSVFFLNIWPTKIWRKITGLQVLRYFEWVVADIN